MIADGRYVATVDRIEEDLAVVLIESEGDVVAERAVSVDRVPEAARRDGAVLDVEIRDGECREIAYDEETTEERRRRLQERFDRLAERPPDDEDDRETPDHDER